MLYNVNTLSGSLSSQNIENKKNTSAKYTALMLGVRHKKAFGGLPPIQVKCAATIFGCSRVFAHSLMRKSEQTGTSTRAIQ